MPGIEVMAVVACNSSSEEGKREDCTRMDEFMSREDGRATFELASLQDAARMLQEEK